MEKWLKNKDLLNAVFFTDKDVIQRNSVTAKDFWLFLEKYERFNAQNRKTYDTVIKTNLYNIPEKYSKHYKVNFELSRDVIKKRFNMFRKDTSLKMDDMMEFQKVILYYLDFVQKKSFSKLLKLKQDQNNLPIKQYEQSIVYALQQNQVVIVAGDTGCGKSTQVPQYLLLNGYSNIACTQPRRLACISLAKRVGFETLNEYKSDIAYQVRFETNRTKNTKVVFLTEGLLLRQFQSDPNLSMYDVVVVDEVHERHINGDFLLGVLKCLLQHRSDLKLILMSATINIDLFASYFHDAPVIQVPGRLYPIELQYMQHFVQKSELKDKHDRLDPSPYLKVMQLIDKKYPSSERGDLLIFMSGMSEIAAVVEAAKEYAAKSKSWIILPLHSSLSVEEQDKIFDVAPDGVRKCIVSTNIAETSITIDGVRFIADSGKVKEMSYDPQVKMQRLQEFWISQASAEQRKGRAGRTGPGVCFRLYSEEDYCEFSNYSTPEIHRVPLDTLVLHMASLGLRDATRFPFIEPPMKASLVNATYFLKLQNALNTDGTLTPLGRMLSRLPVDIVIGKMLVMGSLFSIIEPILVIATALSVQSPLTKRFDSNAESCDIKRKELFSEHGDPFTLLSAYDEWIIVKSDRRSNSRKWCKHRGLEEQRFYEMSKLKQQFEDLLIDHGLMKKSNIQSNSIERDERNELLKLKREHSLQSNRKRKVLKLESNNGDLSSESDDNLVDINDINFKLRHNLSSLEKSSMRNRKFTHRDIILLKLILSSGLYPQIAVPDETNPWRKQNEQVFHTKDKQFLMLHPTSVYSLHPDFLENLYNTDKASSTDKQTTDGRYIHSRELLLYVSLLETNKPYIVNTARVPALQTLLLLSSSIDTNSDCSTLVFDNWLEMSFETNFDTKLLISSVVQIRSAWDMLLEQKLCIYEDDDEKEIGKKLKSITKLENIVSQKLAEFIDTDISYKLRRISSAEIKHMFIKSLNPNNIDKENTEDLQAHQLFSGKENSEKGGISVTPYLTYGCVVSALDCSVSSGQANFLCEHYHCLKCEKHLICTVVERIQHDKECVLNSLEEESVEISVKLENKTEISCHAVKKESYFCEDCSEEFEFSAVEILKHKKFHKCETTVSNN
ncbi:probable ATP-dependent RNA helicase DHX34 isoform X1 [Hydra vulgaris]|uniref:probable ATP-dependent RNA helicase DHX34 isoform X1 n=1 Tax=Hydra vulgaris TaxID=6087 RepID=UPI000640C186|nr:unnamed protein product [Hydra vulgaris]XP_047128394.1 probable ATP-dependent RNA helicase DHX34 [Hydra vulgaris]XP_047128395.1 probable ATP-dependent RNA helicase DHX34 [Hydra vulgaris]